MSITSDGTDRDARCQFAATVVGPIPATMTPGSAWVGRVGATGRRHGEFAVHSCGPDPLGTLDPGIVIAIGTSRSAGRLVT